MKKILSIYFMFFLSIFCGGLHAQPLVKMIHNPGSLSERHYNFSDDGILLNISNGSGNLIHEFFYDGDGRLTSMTTISPTGTVTDTSTWTYDDNGVILAHNGEALTYDAAENKYFIETITPDYSSLVSWTMNEVGLLKYYYTYFEESDGAVMSDNFSLGYSEGNVVLRYTDSWGMSYWSSHDYVQVVNPLKQQLMPVLRALSLNNPISTSSPSMMYSFYLSEQMVVSNVPDDGVEGAVYFYEVNSQNRPVKQHYQTYYLGEPDTNGISMYFYYLGDDIP